MRKDWVFLALFLIVALSRFLPHPNNFSPVGAIALFAGFLAVEKKWALWAPMAMVLVTDLFLGLHATMIFVYGAYLGIAWLGRKLEKPGFWRVGLGAVLSSVFFFVVTNFGVWAMTDIYARDWAGLSACFVAAVPFFQNTLASNLIFSFAFLGGYVVANRWEKSGVFAVNS